MTVSFHPDVDMLVEYSAGSLGPALSVAVSTHLHFCSECQLNHGALTEIGGAFLRQTEAVELNDGALDSVLSALDELPDLKKPSEPETFPELNKLPKLLRQLFPISSPKWHSLLPSLRVAKARVGDERFELGLYNMNAGGNIPYHDHNGLEVTLVLNGSFSDDQGRYSAGDFVVRRPGDKHKPMGGVSESCLSLAVAEGPIKFLGPVNRLLNPLIHFKPR